MAVATVLEAQVAVFKALGHPTRLRIVSMLAEGGGKCVGELVEALGFDQSTVSKHLALLRSVGIVTCAKEGLAVRYGLRMRCAYEFMKCVERVETGADGRTGCAGYYGAALDQGSGRLGSGCGERG